MTSGQSAAAAAGAKRRSLAPIVAAVFCGTLLTGLNTNTVNLAVPALMASFGASMETVRWAVTGYMLGIGIGSPLAGYVYRRFGGKRAYLGALLGYIAASLLCAVAFNLPMLLVSRALQGLAGGLIGPITLTLLYRNVAEEKRSVAVGFWEAAGWTGPAVGPVVAGFCLQALDWRWLFWLNVPLLLLAFGLVLRYVPGDSSHRDGRRFDAVGALLSAAGSFGLLLGFSQASAWGAGDARVLALIGGGALLLALFVRRQLADSEPMLEFRVFRRRSYAVSVAIVGLLNGALFAVVYFVPFYLQTVHGMSALSAGMTMLPSSVVMVLLLPFVGKLNAKWGPLRLSAFGIAVTAIATGMLAALSETTGQAEIVLWTVLRNVGLSFSSMPLLFAGLSGMEERLVGHASAMTNWVRQCMGAMAVAILTTAYAWRTPEGADAAAVTGGVGHVFGIVAVAIACTLPALALLVRRPKRQP